MNDLEILRDAWGQPDPPSPAAYSAARAALLERQRAMTRTGRRRKTAGPAGRESPGGVATAPGRRGRRRAWRLALAGAVSLALAAVVTAQAIRLGDSGPAPAITARELAYRTSAAAAAQPEVAPGQWVYWREKTVGAQPAGPRSFQVWTTADSRKAAYVDHGKVKLLRPQCGNPGTGSAGGCQSIGQPVVSAAAPPHRGAIISYLSGRLPVSYADLGSLPASPAALGRHLGRLHLPGWGPASAREFEIIRELLITYVMPPALTAELYRALGDIPGVAVDHHAVDVAGRHGVGFYVRLPRPAGGVVDEIVINPRTYRLMGGQLVAGQPGGSAQRVLSGTAILQSALVPGPGVKP
jgi:hypothetical protein